MSGPFYDPNAPRFPWYQPPVTPKPPPQSLSDVVIRPLIANPFSNVLIQPKRPRVFVSYHHASDQVYYNQFSAVFHDAYDLIFDNSLDEEIDSNDTDYVRQQIRDEHISSTSCTIVLVGPATHERKYVDWEIKATLDKKHGLIGIQLPNVIPNYLGRVTVPQRLSDNIDSAYALWQGFTWQDLVKNPPLLNQLVQIAAARDKSLIVNPKEIKKQNG